MNGQVTIKSLSTKSIDGIPTDNFMTVSTDQTIEANTMISRILSHDVEAKLFNNMKRFADNVVLLGRDNVIECKYSYEF